MANYLQQAQSDAWQTLENFVDEMVEQWRESGEVSNDLNNDYDNGDAYHHESHVDREYRLTEAAELLDELSEYEESDYGLWQGLDPRKAISAQAAYTYGNAVYGEWSKLVDEINDHLEGLEDRMPDATDEQVKAAGERLIRLYVELQEWRRDLPEDEGKRLTAAAWLYALEGDRTAALVLADWYQEHDQEHKAKRIREAVSAEVETEEDES